MESGEPKVLTPYTNADETDKELCQTQTSGIDEPWQTTLCGAPGEGWKNDATSFSYEQ
jgi:hypothetical protein